MKFSRAFILTGIVLSGFIAKSRAQSLKLANVLQSNMVVQQGKPMRVWGTAKPGDRIKINFDWEGNSISIQADAEGNWKGQISVPQINPGNFTPHTLIVIDHNDIIKLSNLLIGDIWFCVGQSNMDFPMQEQQIMKYPGMLDYANEIAAANYPNIRIYKAAADFKINPVPDTKGEWKTCSPQTIADFSAVAYYFGRELFKKLNIPIGLVVSAAPGASTQAFTSKAVLESDTLLKHTYLDPYAKLLSSQNQVDTTAFFTKVTKPTLLYNAVIYPLLNLSIKGIAFYQGESNVADKRETYQPLFTAMLADWRKQLKQEEIPFYYTQIAPFREANVDSADYQTALFRETQESFLAIKSTAMAVTMDVGEVHNVHPRDKKTVGQRLAFAALNETYDKNVPYKGPRINRFVAEGGKVTLYFRSQGMGSGLATNDGRAPRHFYIAGEDHIFYPADAEIVGKTVVLSSEKVDKPMSVRYAFTDAPITNFQNKEGLPAVPFRTDEWEK